jgi:hypothetical protein
MFSSNTTQVSDGGYQISRSLRFNSADTAYLTRTPASASNRKTWTWSAWVKRGAMDRASRYTLFASRPTANPYTLFYFSGSTQSNRYGLRFEDSSADLATTQVFRDPSAWYHIVLAVDTTQATASNRIKMYVNGSQITVFSTASYPSQNTDMLINNTTEQCIGDNTYDVSTEAYDGYMTEVNFIDGQALTPSSFGETNAQTGVWQPKAYSGSYGTNGFYLNFSDNSNTTAATLGKDYSGNGNNWTPNNFSVTAGAGNDSLVDSPTSYGVDTGVGGTVRGNYCTLNPLSVLVGTTSNGNLDGDTGTTNGGVVYATMNIPNSGKWYWEYTQTNTGTSYSGIETVVSSTSGSISNIVRYIGDGTKQVDGTTSSYGASYGNTDIIGTAVDVDAGTVTFYKNGTSQGAITYATASINITPSWRDGSGSASLSYSANFGQRPFVHAAPSGFKALCTQNLPTPTIGATTATQAGKFFDTSLYTGNAGALTVTNSGFQPDWLWIKRRDASGPYHNVFDSVRGVNKILFPNVTDAEFTSAAYLTSFNSGGFTLGAGDTGTNANAALYVGWQWKANGSGSSNTAGSITSTVSANTTSGFSVVTYTGTGTTATIGHGLGVAPSMVIVKSRSTPASTYAARWSTYHISLGNTKVIRLESTEAAATASYWNNTTPTSAVFSVDGDIYGANVSGVTYVAYCFAEVAGYSKFGSYTGNGSADGPFVFTGFRPAYVMFKRTDASSNWYVFDVARNTSNVMSSFLLPNDPLAETSVVGIDFLSNGFKQRGTAADYNASGGTFIYMAFATNPFKYSLAR